MLRTSATFSALLLVLLLSAAAHADTIDRRVTPLPTWYGAYDREEIAWAVASCDLDNDGAGDFIITSAAGSPLGRSHAGELYVIWGGQPRWPATTYLDAQANHDLMITGAVTDGEFGFSVAVDDVDGDGRQDLLVGERGGPGPSGQISAGRAWVIWGDTRANLGTSIDLLTPDSRVTRLVGVDAADQAGYNVDLFDWNNDGKADIFVSAPYTAGPNNGRSDAGEVRVVYGRTRASMGSSINLGTQSDVVIYGPVVNGETGQSLSHGDFDGDGILDFVVGAPRAAGFTGQAEAGRVMVLFGPGPASGTVKDLAAGADMTIYGQATSDQLGGVVPWPFQQRSLMGLDWNGDGRDDIAMGALFAGITIQSGVVYVKYGAPRDSLVGSLNLNGAPGVVRIEGPDFNAWTGLCLASADFDRDGRKDLVITSPRADWTADGRTDCGQVFVINGRPRAQTPLLWDLSTDFDRRFIGADTGDLLGIYAFAGDIDGDLVPDLELGACAAAGPTNSIPVAGEAYLVYSPSPTGVIPTPPARLSLSVSGRQPAIGSVDLVLSMPRRAAATVEVMDLSGRRIATLAHETFEAGAHPLRWTPGADGVAAPSGVYLITARSPLGRATTRAVVLQ